MQPTVQNATAKIVSALVIGLVVGFALGVFWESRRGGNYPTDSLAAAEQSTDMTAVVPKSASTQNETTVLSVGIKEATTTPSMVVMVENQSAGASVEVTRVKSALPVWVAVREMNGGVAGNILGAQRIPAGEQSVSIELLRPTVKAGSYAIALYADNGDPAFNYREDILIPDVQGAFVAE